MNRRALFVISLAAFLALFVLSCKGGSPTEPESSTGSLHFIDSGCTCGNGPFPPIVVFIDGKQAGLLPIFGSLTVNLLPGPHTWSIDDASGPTSVTIQAGHTETVRIMSNINCPDACTDDNATRHQQR